VSLAESPLLPERQRQVVDACARHLLTSFGLRSLAPGHPQYHGGYCGGPKERDAVYHQGPAWAWLLGPFVRAHLRVYGDPAAARTFLEPLAHHLEDYGVGSIAEIFEGDPPFRPRGCIAQAWSVSETLRAWMETARERSRMPATHRGPPRPTGPGAGPSAESGAGSHPSPSRGRRAEEENDGGL
jgi:glycogen debranching enzyme